MSKYKLRKKDILLRNLLNSQLVSAVLLTGKSGTGKTFFTQCFADDIEADYLYMLCHDGITSEDLYYGVNVGKAVLREGSTSQEIYQKGILLKAIEISQTKKVVVCIDELDKTSRRTENMFLDFTQNYRCMFLDTMHHGIEENITIFFTSNLYREHSEAFLRRCYRHSMEFLSKEVESQLLGGDKIAEHVVDLLNAVRTSGGSSPSTQEGRVLINCLRAVTTIEEVKFLLDSIIVKTSQDADVVEKSKIWVKLL